MASKTFGDQVARLTHLVHGGKGGLAGEIADMRSDVDAAFTRLEENGGLIRTVEWTDVVASGASGIKESIASSAAIAVYSGTDLDGAIGEDEMIPPRNPTVTSTLHADIDAVDVVFAGKIRDENDDLIDKSVTVTLTDGGDATDEATECLSTVESITVPAQSGTGGALEFGIGELFGMPAPMKSRAGLLAPIREIAAGVVVTTGTFTTAAAQDPHGTYLPATVADGSNDYSLTFEVEEAS